MKDPRLGMNSQTPMSDSNFTFLLQIGISKIVGTRIRYINVVHQYISKININQSNQSNESVHVGIDVFFDGPNDFKRMYARMKDEEDPITKRKPKKPFKTELKEELKRWMPTISTESFVVVSSDTLFASYYTLNIFATNDEIMRRDSIDKNLVAKYVTNFKYSIFNGYGMRSWKDEVETEETTVLFSSQLRQSNKMKINVKFKFTNAKAVENSHHDVRLEFMHAVKNLGFGNAHPTKTYANSRLVDQLCLNQYTI